MNRDFRQYVIPFTIKDWRVGTSDGHLNEHATDQVMSSAHQVRTLISDRTPFAFCGAIP
jgi:hypothetical protein